MKILFPITILFFLTSCSLYEQPEAPKLDAPQQFKTSILSANYELEDRWWENFDDEQLNEIVNLALKNNYNYQTAIKNIEIAQTYVTQNQSYLFPQVTGDFDASRIKPFPVQAFGTPGTISNGTLNPATLAGGSNRIFDFNTLSATVTYELDVWNQVRNTLKSSEAAEVSSYATSNVVKLTLISNVVDTYFQIMALEANLINLNEQYRAAKEITNLVKVQFDSELVDAGTVYAAESEEYEILSTIKTIEKQKEIYENTLAYLISDYPENFSITTHNTLNKLQYTQLIPANYPSEMLAIRPDIQVTYYQMISYGYLEKAALANFLPSFNLTSGYGYASNTLGQLLKSSSSFWNYGINATQTIFDYAITISEYQRSKYQFEAAILSYKDTVINAFSEVNSALVSYQDDNEALNAIKMQYDVALQQLLVSDAQYKGELIDYSTYLTNELAALQDQYNLTNQQLLVVQDIVQVYKTLGWGLQLSDNDETKKQAKY